MMKPTAPGLLVLTSLHVPISGFDPCAAAPGGELPRGATASVVSAANTNGPKAAIACLLITSSLEPGLEHRDRIDRRTGPSRHAGRRDDQHELPALQPRRRFRRELEVEIVEQV